MNPEPKAAADVQDAMDFTARFGVSELTSKLLGLRAAEAYCRKLPAFDGLAACADQVITDHGLQIDQIKQAARCIPENGALLVTANHPTGILDGAVLLCALLSRRSDVSIVANDLLSRIPVLGEYVIPIKKTDSQDAGGYHALMRVRRAWKRNECVVVFPAGTVAHWQWKTMAVSDAPWTTGLQNFAATLNVAECRATITVGNPLWFHVCAAVSRKARLALLLRAFLSAEGVRPTHPVAFNFLSDPSLNAFRRR